MTAITFDTLKSAEKLTKAGFSPEQAKAIVETEKAAFQETLENGLATKEDIRGLKEETKNDIWNLKEEMNKRFLPLEKKLFVHDWMLGFVLFFQASILLKLFL